MTERVAIVTGASGGIGAAVAARLGQAGMAVAVHYSENRSRAEETANSIVTGGGRALTVSADIADARQVVAMFDQVVSEFDGVDVVVNTAGIMLLAPLAELSLDDFDRMHRINVRGAFIVSQQAVRRIRSGGAIINVSSSVTKLALTGYTGYAATKGAVDAMTLILAKEMRGRDVTVNAIAPGPTATPLFLDGKPQEVIDRLASMTPMERLGGPADIAEMVAFLAGPGRWVNGQVIYANGGVA